MTVSAMQIRPYDNLDEPAVIALWNEELGDAAPHNFPATNIRKKLAVDRDLFLVTAELRSSLAENILRIAGIERRKGFDRPEHCGILR